MDDGIKPISQIHAEWLEKRGIGPDTQTATGIYSGRHVQDGDGFRVVPDHDGNVLVFPYFRHGVEVNDKYRGPQKRFYQRRDGQKVFWNADALDDPSLHDGRHSLVITEGEMDAAAVIESGYPFVVSVPDGAPPPRKDGDYDEGSDDKYSYILNDWDAIKKIKRIVIATDNDEPGKRLAEELVRRLGRVRCSFVKFPDGCKDFNEVLMQHGSAAVVDAILAAKPYPVSGVYTFSELPEEPPIEPSSTGWHRLDEYLMLFYPAFMVVTGTAGSGKSTWTNQLVAQLNLTCGWKAAIASFEMRINPFVTDTLRGVFHDRVRRQDISVNKWLNDNFVFIAPEPSDESEQFDIDWLIDKASAAVVRHGIRVLVIDPWNEIEHAVNRRESLTEYTGRAIRALKRFGREFECLVIVVAHPAKSGASKDPDEISLYDVSDSAHFANKADFGVVIARMNSGDMHPQSNVMVKKVRYQPISGKIGSIVLSYDAERRLFTM